MEQQEKIVMRARLIASGILRYHKFNVSSVDELNRSVEILAEELARIEAQDVVLSIREAVEHYGLKVPEISAAVLADAGDDLGRNEWIEDGEGVRMKDSKQVPFRYVRRANNQISEPLEALIWDLLGHGWTKSAIAKALRVNRRVVIRIAHEAQSAQKTRIRVPNDLGKK
jgi:hypothetical protein